MANKIEEPKFGHYMLPEILNYMYCYTCLMIVLDKSEKVKETFEEIKKCWELPGCKQLIDGVLSKTQNKEKFLSTALRLSGLDPKEDRTLKLKDTKTLISGMRKEISLYILSEKIKLFFNRRKSKDYRKLEKCVDDFIKIAFNRESDRAKGKYKITAKSSKTLVEVVYLFSLSEIKKINLGIITGLGKIPAVVKRNNTYTFEDLVSKKVPRSIYSKLVDEYQKFGFGLKNEETIVKNAYIWCQCRIFYKSVEEYCNFGVENENGIESANIIHKIKECDEALNYPRGNKAIK